MRIRGRVIEQQRCLSITSRSVERIVENHEYVHIVRDGFVRHKGAIDNEACEMPRTSGNVVDALEAVEKQNSLSVGRTERLANLAKRSGVDPSR